MSYVLHIWEHPVPTGVLDADRIHTLLTGQDGSQNPKFLELAKRLTARYPCLTTVGDDEESVWSDGPLDGRTDEPIYGIGVQSGSASAVIPFVADAAGALGLTVYDMQAGTVHLPGGKVLALPGALPASAPLAAPGDNSALSSKAQVGELLIEGLRPLMESRGFRVGKGGTPFKRKRTDCQLAIGYSMSDHRPTYVVAVVPIVELEYPAPHAAIAAQQLGKAVYMQRDLAACAAGTTLEESGVAGFKVDNVAGLQHEVAAMASFLEAAVLPVFDRCDTLATLEEEFNRRPVERNVFGLAAHGLVLAHALKSPRFDALVAEHFAAQPDDWSRGKVEKLVAALRELE
ncbi:MAG: hypothetical protein ABI699_00755 [Caldimonas sp.]